MTDLAPFPAELVDLLTASAAPTSTPRPAANGNGYKPAYRYGEAALIGELVKVRAAVNGTRNSALNDAAFALGQLVAAGALDRSTVEAELMAAALDVGLGETESRLTIASGLKGGEQQPRVIPEPVHTSPPMPEPPPDDPQTTDAAPAQATAARARRQPPTDDELRDRFRVKWPNVVYGLGEFHAFDGAIYQPLDHNVIAERVAAVLEAAKPEGVRPSGGRVASVLELLRFKVFVETKLWNANAGLLPCANGVLDIAARELRPHSPQHYFTSMLPYSFDPAARAPVWEWFLGTVFAADVIAFLQEFVGYALTTSMLYELAVWLYGPPGSGKSTFLGGLQAMLGTRAGLLSLADVERSRFALANLPGKTLVVSTEQPSDYIASGGTLNALISGEPLMVDRKFKDALQVVSTAKIAWAMNSLPRVGDTNSGLFRRVKVVKFPALEAEKRDPTVKDDIALEGAGLLNWALAGLDRLKARGRFDVPPAVVAATEEFRVTNDVPAQFVAECCVVGPEYKVRAGQLYTAYKAWCLETGHKPQSMTSLAMDWDRLGFEKYQPGGVVHRRGVGLCEVRGV